MPDARPPVAIRITRPYTSEDEFLANEIETLSRTSVFLVGAPTRPQGVVLRFEVVLENGTPLVRGEGRVMAYKEDGFKDGPGLILRFTRLDTRSKALVDRAAALRAEQTSAGPMSTPSVSMRVPVGSETGSAPSVSSIASFPSMQVMAPVSEAADTERQQESVPVAPPSSDRDGLLEKLRARARGLDVTTVRQILQKRARS